MISGVKTIKNRCIKPILTTFCHKNRQNMAKKTSIPTHSIWKSKISSTRNCKKPQIGILVQPIHWKKPECFIISPVGLLSYDKGFCKKICSGTGWQDCITCLSSLTTIKTPRVSMRKRTDVGYPSHLIHLDTSESSLFVPKMVVTVTVSSSESSMMARRSAEGTPSQ